MVIQIKRLKKPYLFFLFAAVCAIIGVYPGTGGEGAQREISNFDNKIDWWNFLTAFLYGYWPMTFNNWQFSLTILQLTCFVIGIWFFYNALCSNRYKLVILIPALVGGYFVMQLWRDASLFAYSVLALSLVTNLAGNDKRKMILKIFCSLLILIVSSLFKPIFAPIIFLIFFFLIYSEIRTKFRRFVTFFCLILLSCVPMIFDKYLSDISQLTKSYPEQQVYIYDISKMYCWGFSPEVVEKSKKALLPLMTSLESKQSICTSLSPTGWDSLRVKIPDVSASPAIHTLGENDDLELLTLRKNWLSLIFSNPTEWLLVKVSDMSQVLTMANAFYMPGIFQNFSNNLFADIGDLFLKFFLVPIQILDKFRVLSLGASLLIGFGLLYWNKNQTNLSKYRQTIIVRFLIVNFLTLTMASLAFIANNGRYIMPYMLLSYLYLVWGFGTRSKFSTY